VEGAFMAMAAAIKDRYHFFLFIIEWQILKKIKNSEFNVIWPLK
jgi:hypothetical protein